MASGTGRDGGGRHSGEARGAALRDLLGRMSDDELRAEYERRASATWRRPSLVNHAKKHRLELLALFGRVLAPDDVGRISQDVLRSWERVFIEVEPDGRLTYLFVKLLDLAGAGIIVAVRESRVRSMFVAIPFQGWFDRHRLTVEEVTSRVREPAP